MLAYNEYIMEAKSHELSGVVLIVDNSILLVRPKKFRRRKRRFSIPKGRIESKVSKLKTALRELEEESRIKLKKKHLKGGEKTILNYMKAGYKKQLTCYIVRMTRDELKIPFVNNMILRHLLRNEIEEAGLFSKEDAMKHIERHQIPLLEYLDNVNVNSDLDSNNLENQQQENNRKLNSDYILEKILS